MLFHFDGLDVSVLPFPDTVRPAKGHHSDTGLLQSNGKIVAAGAADITGFFALARYNIDGSLDRRFGSRGKIITSFGGSTTSINSIIQQTNGKLVAAGFANDSNYTSPNFALARYNPYGRLDSNFDGDGKVITTFDGYEYSYATTVLAQGNGKLVAIGVTNKLITSLNGNTTNDIALVRYMANGALDTTFGDGGKIITDVGLHDYASAAALQIDGKIVVIGGTYDNQIHGQLSLLRYNANGSLDNTFGNGGIVMTSFGDNFRAGGSDIAVQTDGKLVVTGLISPTNTYLNYVMARFNSDGSLDSSFGNGGTIVFNDTNYLLEKLALAADGKILIGGAMNGLDFLIMRYNTDGSLDTSFNGL